MPRRGLCQQQFRSILQAAYRLTGDLSSPSFSSSSSSAFANSELHVKRRTALGPSNHTDETATNPALKKPPVSGSVGARQIKLNAVGTSVGVPPVPPMSFPTSPQSLYRNLLLVTSNPPFSVSQAIDYYFDLPKALHSTRSFNLLISLALRSASFASVARLFDAMRAESIPANMETWKLQVRWSVRIGKWNEAWKRVLEISGQQNGSTKLPRNAIPLPLWLELFGSQKRGALRHWVVADQEPNVQHIPGAGNNMSPDAHQESGASVAGHVSLPLRKRFIPRPSQRSPTVELLQYRALMQVSPLLTSSDQVQILPRTVLIITQTMHRVGQKRLAFSTALAYLKSLPLRLTRCDRRRVLDLVHSHLSMVAQHRKPGLKQHFTQRRILWKFLRARPGLVPSSRTLFLLLGPLRGCRRSGTLAMQCLRLFEKRWGPRIQSRLVRRRVASLALKEGRLDIVETMIRLDRRCKVFDDTYPRTVCKSRRSLWCTSFSRRGVENRRWRSIEEKYRRRLLARSPS